MLWHNMREEPVLYINGRPYVVREADKPFQNLEYTGIDRSRVEDMETRLKNDVLQEVPPPAQGSQPQPRRSPRTCPGKSASKRPQKNARVAVRNIRRDANNHLKEMLKKKEAAEDEERRAQEEIQKLTDRHIAEIDKLLQIKEADLLAV